MYVTVRVDGLPAVSVAVTSNVLVPVDEVSIGFPFATGPRHEATPEPPSSQS